jgi:3-oxoacyl-[acyl-carrier-protein] synthase-3
MNDAYIVEMGSYLPNAPVENDAMESVLGMVGERPSRARRITLRNNGIRLRHYAIDPATGKTTHNNAQLTAAAVREGLQRAAWRMGDVDVLACGTSTPDQLKPGHAAMVHAELGEARLEAVSAAGVCCAGMAALKYAYLMVRTGEARRAVATGSELCSTFMVARNFCAESPAQIAAVAQRPGLAFEKDFLRWMLSDGAGSALLSPAPNNGKLSLRIEWIEGTSLANELPVCMYTGAIKLADGRLRGWREAENPGEIAREHYFAIKQDARLLDEHIARLVAADTIGAILAKHAVRAADIDWFLPHYSSQYFRPVLARALEGAGVVIPEARWYTNLATVGNVGAASIYLMLDELWRSGQLARGQRLLCLVPESARFSVYYMLLTVV